MTAFSSGLKVLMISARGTEERERGQRGEKWRVKVCRDKRASRGQYHESQVTFSLPEFVKFWCFQVVFRKS